MPRRSATRLAVEDFPDAAGPSMAITRCFTSRRGGSAADTVEIPPEVGIGDRDALAVVHLDRITVQRPEHAEGHRDAMISVRRHASAKGPVRSPNDEPVAQLLGVGADGAKV